MGSVDEKDICPEVNKNVFVQLRLSLFRRRGDPKPPSTYKPAAAAIRSDILRVRHGRGAVLPLGPRPKRMPRPSGFPGGARQTTRDRIAHPSVPVKAMVGQGFGEWARRQQQGHRQFARFRLELARSGGSTLLHGQDPVPLGVLDFVLKCVNMNLV